MIEIREVDLRQADVIVRIISESFRKQAEILNITKDQYPSYVAFETLEALAKKYQTNKEHLVLAYKKDIPIGTVRYNASNNDPTKGYINRLAVIPTYRGNNFGSLLMTYAEAQLKKAGVNTVEISIVSQFEKLKKYYIGLGYKSIGDKTFASLPFSVHFLEKKI